MSAFAVSAPSIDSRPQRHPCSPAVDKVLNEGMFSFILLKFMRI